MAAPDPALERFEDALARLLADALLREIADQDHDETEHIAAAAAHRED